ncbi:MAG: helix-turn-helix transcriptional regulator [Paracoccaceae bacterium]
MRCDKDVAALVRLVARSCGKLLDQVAFGALVKRKRGEMRLTQETLAGDIFGDSTRKADISRIENGKVTPQEATIQKLCTALGILPAEMEPIRQARSIAGQIDNVPTLSRRELEDLSNRFGIENPYDKGDDELRSLIADKADDLRSMRRQIASLDDRHAAIAELKEKAQAAADAGQLEEVDAILGAADFAETQINAQTKITRAHNALLRNRVEQAYDILSAVADSFGSVDATAPAKIRLQLEGILYQHGLRYGGSGMKFSEQMIRKALDAIPRDSSSELWAAGQNSLAITLKNQGIRTEGPKGADLLEQAVIAYRAALEVYTRTDHPMDWAATQNNLGNALGNQGSRTDGPKGADLLEQAITAFRAALEVRTRTDHAVNWAATQNNLGNALGDQGNRTEGSKGTDLLEQAVTAFRAALEVLTRTDHPMDWAMTQNNLGNALGDQGNRTEGSKGADILEQAVTASRAALEVYTRTDHPMDWVATQNNLGNALRNQSNRAEGPKGADLLEQAVTAYRAALEVRTRTDHPVNWAMTQNNLGNALGDQGHCTEGQKGADQLEQAVTAFRAALEVHTRTDHPVDWATTQNNIAITLTTRALRSDAKDPGTDLAAALDAVDLALEVFDPEHMSYNHRKATALRQQILSEIDALSDPKS